MSNMSNNSGNDDNKGNDSSTSNDSSDNGNNNNNDNSSSDNDNNSRDNKPAYVAKENVESMRHLPSVNLPEKILFVIDTVREKNCTPFKLSTGAKYTPLFMIKRAIENFICIKSTIQRSHEYALMILNSQGALWISDFTNNIKSIVNQLDVFDEDILEDNEKSCDFCQLFEQILSKLQCLQPKKRIFVPPMFVTRVILIYSRSNCVPKFQTDKKWLEKVTENPYLFIDALYVHEPPCSDNLCEEIYKEVATLDTTNLSYILEVGRNAAKLHDNMAKLLAHPLQRPPQKDACYTIYPFSSSQEVHVNV
ncbi:BRISC and BRCA1-A complex member 1 [Calliopsis andreniformis]|uniref:BRISC and BRCA1-A complex member 1 n=1 Tax=Calliopsis andreniformis TaxID=337506 RepID=UPI003FCC50A5